MASNEKEEEWNTMEGSRIYKVDWLCVPKFYVCVLANIKLADVPQPEIEGREEERTETGRGRGRRDGERVSKPRKL